MLEIYEAAGTQGLVRTEGRSLKSKEVDRIYIIYLIETGKLIDGSVNLVNPVNHVDASLLRNLFWIRVQDGWHGNC